MPVAASARARIVVASILNVFNFDESEAVLPSAVVRKACYNKTALSDVSRHGSNQASLPGYNVCIFGE
jgi:hypothetical protein